jgi:hypothetical protein
MNQTQMPGRDPRIDFFRGLTLLIIFSTHLSPNFFKKLLPIAYGFFDAAEVFVFLSGFVCGMVYKKTYLREGLTGCLSKALGRCKEIYLAHLVSLALVLTLISLCSRWVSLEEIGAGLFLSDPLEALQRALLLSYFPLRFDILPLYLALLLLLPGMLWLRHRAGMAAMLAASLALYVLAQLFPQEVRLPGAWGAEWYFNPLAWQLLFFGGVALASWPSEPRARVARSRALVVAAAAVVALAPVLKIGYTALCQPAFFQDSFVLVAEGGGRAIPYLRQHFPLTGKSNLEPLRLVHFFAVVGLCIAFVPRAGRLWDTALSQALIRCGQHSLVVFCAHLVLIYLGRVALQLLTPALVWQLAANLVGWGAMLAFAAVVHWAGTRATRPAQHITPARAAA